MVVASVIGAGIASNFKGYMINDHSIYRNPLFFQNLRSKFVKICAHQHDFAFLLGKTRYKKVYETLLIWLTIVKQIFRSHFQRKTCENRAANAVFYAPLKKSLKNLKKSDF